MTHKLVFFFTLLVALQVLEEAYRVLRPGGRFMCLEFSDVSNPLLKRYEVLGLFVHMGFLWAGLPRDFRDPGQKRNKRPHVIKVSRKIEGMGVCL